MKSSYRQIARVSVCCGEDTCINTQWSLTRCCLPCMRGKEQSLPCPHIHGFPPAQKPQLVPSSCGVTSPAFRPPGESSAGAGLSSVRMQSLPCLMDALPSRDSTWEARPANCACSLRGAQETGAASAASSEQQAASENTRLRSEVPLNLTCCSVSPCTEGRDHLDLEWALAAACGRFCIREIFFFSLHCLDKWIWGKSVYEK